MAPPSAFDSLTHSVGRSRCPAPWSNRHLQPGLRHAVHCVLRYTCCGPNVITRLETQLSHGAALRLRFSNSFSWAVTMSSTVVEPTPPARAETRLASCPTRRPPHLKRNHSP